MSEEELRKLIQKMISEFIGKQSMIYPVQMLVPTYGTTRRQRRRIAQAFQAILKQYDEQDFFIYIIPRKQSEYSQTLGTEP